MSSIFEERFSTVKNTIKCENTKPTSAFMGKSASYHNSGLTLAQALHSPLDGAKHSVNYIKKIEEESGPIHCINSLQATDISIPLSKAWFSTVLTPGNELPDNVIWQVSEKEIMKAKDYKLLIDNGYEWFFQTYFYKVVDRKKYEDYLKTEDYYVETAYDYAYKQGYPILANCTELITIPYETLSGARGLRNFFLDIYTNMEMVREAMDAIWVGYSNIIKDALTQLKNDEMTIGSLIGGWRSASSMINHDIFMKLVWDYLKELGEIFIQNNKVPIFHLDLDWDREIEMFKYFPERSILINTDGSTSLKRARKILGDKYAFVGDVPPNLMLYGKPGQIKEYVFRLLDDVGPKGLFVCPGCDPPYGTTHENFLAVYDAVQNWH